MATLSHLGCVILPDGTLRKLSRGQKLTEEENQLYEMHPSMGCNMIEKIPRLGDVAEAIRYQLKNHDGSGVPHDKLAGAAIPLGARLLKLITDFISAESAGLAPADAIGKLRQNAERYDPELLRALGDYLGVAKVARTIKLSVAMLAPGMVLAKDLMTRDGNLLLRTGQKLTETSRERLLSHLANGVIEDGIEVEPGASD